MARPPLPECGPSLDDWREHLWPWLTAADALPRSAMLLARELAPAVDMRDRTVDPAAARSDRITTRWSQRAALACLIECGALVAEHPGRYRLVPPPWAPVRR